MQRLQHFKILFDTFFKLLPHFCYQPIFVTPGELYKQSLQNIFTAGSGCPGLRWERFPRELRPGEAAARRKKAAVAAKAAAKKAKMDIAARLDQLDKLDQKEKSDDEEEEGKEGEFSGLCFGVFSFGSLLLVAASDLCFLVSVFVVVAFGSLLLFPASGL